MKKYSYYANSMSYPNKRDYSTVFIYNQGKVVFKGTYREYMALGIMEPNVRQEILDEEGYKKAVALYRKTTQELREEFKQDLFEKHDVKENPKREKCFELAWDYRHDDGYKEVDDCFSELVELIK